MDWYLILIPLLILPVVLLFRFVGCVLDTSGTLETERWEGRYPSHRVHSYRRIANTLGERHNGKLRVRFDARIRTSDLGTLEVPLTDFCVGFIFDLPSDPGIVEVLSPLDHYLLEEENEHEILRYQFYAYLPEGVVDEITVYVASRSEGEVAIEGEYPPPDGVAELMEPDWELNFVKPNGAYELTAVPQLSDEG